MLSNLPTFIASVFLLAMIPGQGTAMILRQTLIYGSKTGILTVVSYTAGFSIWGGLSAIGLASIFTQSETAYAILKYLGVAYLLFLSVQGFFYLSKNSSKFEIPNDLVKSDSSPIRTGLTTSLTNVKAAVIAVAFLPAFVPEGFNLALGVFLLGVIWSLTSLSWYLILVLSVGKASIFFANSKSKKLLGAISSIGLLVLSYLLAIS